MILAAVLALVPQKIDQSLYDELRWRCIGPYRGGRTVGATGVPGQPNVFYIGVNNGGVWKTNDAGRTWKPIFDGEPTGSIGAIAVAPSDPNTLYVGSGEGLQRPDLSTGDGMYRSEDAGKTWTHLGLRDGQQIASIIVDAKDPHRLFVAVLGHPYGPNEERGIYRSTDGGDHFQKVLGKDPDTGGVALAFDPSNSKTVYGVLWQARQGPWENGQWEGPGSGLFKSVDGGDTWRQLSNGLPTYEQGLGRIGISVSPVDPNRIYANVDGNALGGVYRSDDAGESWTRVNSEGRVWGRGSDFAEVRADPKNKDVVYSANTSTYKSTDGGKTYHAIKGAPGGDDYHTIWINPDNPEIILLAADQGATITVNGGETWSSWYNQPTAQFYHVSTDNAWPYNVYGGQQESGSAGVASRGNDGQITFREWHPVGAEEYGYVAADPLDPNIIYGGKLTKYDKRTGQVQEVSPQIGRRGGAIRFVRTAPLIFSPIDPHTLFFAGNVLFKTQDGAHSWEQISPDLTREHPQVPKNVGVYTTPDMNNMARRGVIYTIAPSHKSINTIWIGTDDGLIQVTRDGGKVWSNVTPPVIESWNKISMLEAGHSDDQTAYAAVNNIRCDDLRPHIYRTHDGGRSWKEIVTGLPDNASVNSVREDPVRPGLLFCGTELAVYFSIDDGDLWQPLRLNMPATSIRDLVIHGDDLVVGTHGRSFWILDDITALRELSSGTVLYKPETAFRVRWNMNTDTPLPPEEPAGANPPDGAIIDYHLSDSANEVTLEIFDSKNQLVRRYSSKDREAPVDEKTLNVPTYWIRPTKPLSAQAGFHRFLWDMHFTPAPGGRGGYPMTAIFHDTAPSPTGPWALPGNYTVKLTVDGHTFAKPLALKMDPRVTTPLSALEEQFSIAKGCYDAQLAIKAYVPNAPRGRQNGDDDEPLESAHAQTEVSADDRAELGRLAATFAGIQSLVDGADAPPTRQAIQAYQAAKKQLNIILGKIRKG